MEIREKIIVIPKYAGDKIIVRLAKSLENQIRFYLNDDLYVAATEQQDGRKYKVSIGSETMKAIEKEDGKHPNSDSKKEKRRRTKLIILQILVSFAMYIGMMIALAIIGNWRFSLLITSLTMLLIGIVNNAIFNLAGTNKKLRSKHSAEHMMVKFIEANNRMPVSIAEVKKYSRFSLECGSRFYVQSKAEIFSICITTAVITIIFSIIIQSLFPNSGLVLIISMLVYFVLLFLMMKLSEKNKKILEKIIRPIKNILIVINQLTLTTRNVRDQDLVLAYLAAREWMIIVYPEFYDRERDDTIWRENIVDIEIGEPNW